MRDSSHTHAKVIISHLEFA